ncbi:MULTISPECIES: DUF5336 domain-containing protein [Streptomyces]|uniref:DUF5336 domain-containing protein n=1 Tax=Streptomyces solicathayae TaxID=3081768 RepID=A0ABZ0LYQ4_9ACTN|nr:DUF5336 domain-containing protein [Streptomyces sp. HUAS YS2]WOX24638.1 DUF5336 domain-containing protein [Streptomyces sp. HUAS YS2]
MNIRALTRGDGVVIGAAVLLFIASFLDVSSCNAAASICDRVPSTFSWEISQLGWGAFFLGIAGGALVVVSHGLPQPRKVAGLDLAQVGAAFAVAAAWNLLMWIFESTNVGAGLILGTIAALALAGAAVAAPLVPALKAPLVTAPKPQAPQPYGMQPGQQGHPGQPGVQGGYGYPGAQQHQPYGAQPGQPGDPHAQQGQPFGAQQGQPQPGAPEQQHGAQPQPAADFAPFWFAVPVARPLYAEDGSQAPIAELAPGTWYLAVDKRGDALVAQTQDGRRGVLQDTTGIQHG